MEPFYNQITQPFTYIHTVLQIKSINDKSAAFITTKQIKEVSFTTYKSNHFFMRIFNNDSCQFISMFQEELQLQINSFNDTTIYIQTSLSCLSSIIQRFYSIYNQAIVFSKSFSVTSIYNQLVFSFLEVFTSINLHNQSSKQLSLLQSTTHNYTINYKYHIQFRRFNYRQSVAFITIRYISSGGFSTNTYQ